MRVEYSRGMGGTKAQATGCCVSMWKDVGASPTDCGGEETTNRFLPIGFAQQAPMESQQDRLLVSG